MQAKLLRVLQEREIKPVGGTHLIKVDIRLIAATNKDLEAMIGEGTFREDLYYRINVVPIYLPPLREREGDMALLASHFLEKFNRERKKNIRGLSAEAIRLMEEYSWPGNVRELENVIERVVVMADKDIIRPEHLPLNIQKRKVDFNLKIPKDSTELKEAKKRAREEVVKEIDRTFIIEALKRNNWNITRAAGDIGMKRQNLQLLMRKHQIKLSRQETRSYPLGSTGSPDPERGNS